MKTPFEYDLIANEKIREKIREKLGKSKSDKLKLASELNISDGTLYKKLNGDSKFSFGEIAYLSKKYALNLQSLVFHEKGKFNVSHAMMQNPVVTLMDYLDRLKNLALLASSQKDTTVYYISHELPFFYYLLDEKVAIFKLFTFARAIWRLPQFDFNTIFSFDSFNSDITEKITEVWEIYSKINTIEIWNPAIFDNTFAQIQFMLKTGLLDSQETADTLAAGLNNILSRIESFVQSESKSPEVEKGNFILYNNPMLYTNNIILLDSPSVQKVFAVHDNPNFFSSDDSFFYQSTMDWAYLVKKQSYSVTSGQGNHAVEFFNTLKEKMEVFSTSIG